MRNVADVVFVPEGNVFVNSVEDCEAAKEYELEEWLTHFPPVLKREFKDESYRIFARKVLYLP